MKIVPGVAALETRAPRAVAIGNFDGVHLGHQALLRGARERAARYGGEATVLTFVPHPARLFAPEKAPALVMSLERRLELFAEAGMDLAIVEPFTRAFAAIEAEAFVRDVLARDVGARDVVVGYDFSFGRARTGNPDRLRALGAALGIGVEVVAPVAIAGVACSSTKIRALVAEGRAVDAAAYLGRPFELEGRVVRGAGRGRAIGFPTANLAPDGELLPRLGIYAARARVLDGPLAGERRKAALSVGRNPTFVPGGAAAPITVEAYLLDFDGDLYDLRVRLEIGERLRDEQRFASVEDLVAQIAADVARVKALVW
jgi:riboflavin kinase/FMN adenylyltransferase